MVQRSKMMHNRRSELEHSRRDPRERDSSPAGMSRKRPSMLSEFQGKHVYGDRDRSRMYSADNTYTSRSHDYYHGGSHRNKAHMTSNQGGGGGGKYGGPGGSYHRQNYNDPRHRSYHHFPPSRSNNEVMFGSNFVDNEQQHFAKRPKLIDSNRPDKMIVESGKSFSGSSTSTNSNIIPLMDAPGIANATNAPATNCEQFTEDTFPQYGSLQQYLSDIESEDDVDVVVQLDKEQPEQQEEQSQANTERVIKKLMDDDDVVMEKKEEPQPPPVVCKMTKEELLLLMERVDHDIAKVELQVNVLKKKEAELADAEVQLSQPQPPPLPTPITASHDLLKEVTTPPVDVSRDFISTPRLPSPIQPSMVETILAENQRRADSIAGTLLSSLGHAAWVTRRLQPLYWQPCEAPGYHERIERHEGLRPQLVQVIRRRKLELHRRDTKLCEHYETLLNEWEKKVEKTENNTKRKAKDVRNKEFFEKHFPEIKRHTLRLGPKGFSVVRSEAELNEILDELYEQEEALDRYQKAHAPIPPMIFNNSKDDHKFISNNGLVRDPLMMYKERKVTSTWTDEEKQTFCEKYALYPKSFDKISQFIPNKTTADCVQFYYLSKKKENYKDRVIKVKEQKRKAALLARQQLAADAASSYGNSSPCASHMRKLSEEGKSKGKLRLLNETRVPTYTGWTPDEIQRLREGLRLYGRAWGKIYRMVGPVKTATQCKSFFDDYRDDPHLQLHKALSEHNIIKNAQKAKRKAEARKQSASSVFELEKKRRKQKEVIIQESSDDATDDIESDRDSVINSSVVSEKTFSEITTEGETLSSHTDSESSTEEADEVIDHTAAQRTRPNRLPSVRTSEDNIDLLFSAAEALASVDNSNGILGVSTKVALHDHTYSKPTGSLINSSEFQGSSGLSLIAAAAAVVSPTLSSSPTGKSPLLSPVKAPRGRPPSSQKRSNTVGAKLGPTFLSPAGPSMHISLTETKSYRGRGRGTSVPLTKTIPHASKNSGITTKLTIPANRVGKASVMSPTTGPSKFPPFSTGSNKSSSLSHTVTQSSTLAAFEALVNVAAAAKPAELLSPRSSNLNHPSNIVNTQQMKKDVPSVVDLVSVLTIPTPTIGTTSSLHTPIVTLPVQSTLRLPVHSVSSKQTTVVMSTASKPARSLPQKLFTSHNSLESSKSLFTSGHKSTGGKIESPVRTLTVYAPLLAAQQAQGVPVVSSSSLVIRKSAPSSGQHPIFTTTNRTVTETTTSSDGKSQVAVKPPSSKASLLVKGIPPKMELPAKPAESILVDEKKDQLVRRLSDEGSSHTVDSPKPIVSESSTSPDDKMAPVSLQLEASEDNELLSAPLRITLGQGSSSSSKLVPISISRPPEDEVLVLTSTKPTDGETSPKLPANAPVTKAAKKAQKVTKLEKPKSKKPRTSDDYESRKDQPESTATSSQASTDFLSVLMPSLVTDSGSSGNFTTPMFLNSLTSTTGPLPPRSNISHIMDRSHTNSPATDLMSTTTTDSEDRLVSATHDISELSKLLEPLSSDDHQSNLDGHHDKAQAVPSNATDYFCPNAIALSLFSTVPDSEQQEANSTPATTSK